MVKRKSNLTRRKFLKTIGSFGAASAVSQLPTPAFAVPKTIKIGFVTPQTGPLAVFAQPDKFTLGQYKKLLEGGLSINGRKHPVEFVVKDSQSKSNRASSVAQELLLKNKVDFITATATPDTTNPVADQAELNEVPCLTNDTPWQPHFFGRRGDPKKGFNWTYHYFWGLEDIISVFTKLWGEIETSKVVGALWPNDPDGNAWGDPKIGFPPVLKEQSYKLVDTGRFQSLTDDFSAQISAFKKAGVDIVTGVVIPPDFTTFWTQAAQQGFKPKAVTVAKASEFPQAIQALGDRGDGLSVEVWWSPNHPFVSGLTGQTSKELAKSYEKETGQPWTMPLGFKHSLFEVVIDSLKRTQDLDKAASIRDALKETSYQSIVGPIDFSKGPVPNVAKTPLVGGQWLKKDGKFELNIVNNNGHSNIPLTGKMKPITG